MDDMIKLHKIWLLCCVLIVVAGCSNTTTVTVPVVRFYEDHELHDPSPVVSDALSKVQLGPWALVYRLGDGVVPIGTKLRYSEKDIFTASEAGTFIFVDLEPECDWAHRAVVYFIANRSGAKAVVAHGSENSLSPGHMLIGSDGEELDSLWQELEIKRGTQSEAGTAVATAMADTNSPVVVRVGMLPQSEWQHPLSPGFAPGIQSCLDVTEGRNPPKQIILIYPRDMKPPTKTNTLVEVKGHLHMIQMEVPSNLEKKDIYKNEVIGVTSWRYVVPPP